MTYDTRSWRVSLVTFTVAWMGSAWAQQPEPVLISPEPGEVISSSSALRAEQQNESVDPFDITIVNFEYLVGDTWAKIDDDNETLSDYQGPQVDSWEALWDLEALPSGSQSVRVSMSTDGVTLLSSDPVAVLINKPPQAGATARPGGLPGEVLFDGSPSEDPDGTIQIWEWEFGDGTSGTGPTVSHVYTDTSQDYEVSLTVEDDQGARDAVYYVLSFDQDQTIAANTRCICKSISINTMGMALGPQGNGRKSWPQQYGHDGRTLGGFNRNPLDPKGRTGLAYEVVATVEGNPKCCTETQVSKATTVFKGFSRAACEGAGGTWDPVALTCTEHTPWTGKTADLDADGVDDLDFSTQQKCLAAGGKWDGTNCHLSFPQDPQAPGYKGYKPHSAKGKSRYDNPEKSGGLKAHAGTKILWLSLPHFEGGVIGSTGIADLIAIIRGTDGKYCYRKVRITLNKKEGGSEETAVVGEEVVGADRVDFQP